MISRRVSNNKMEAIFYFGENKTKHKTLLLLSGSQGGFFSDKYKIFVENLVSNGYAVLDLAYFRKGNLPVNLKNIKLEYFENALLWLSEQPEAIRDEVAVLGVSKGGELALVLASRYPQFKAVVAAVPSNVVFQGIGLPYLAGSSWSYKGKPPGFCSFCRFTLDSYRRYRLYYKKF